MADSSSEKLRELLNLEFTPQKEFNEKNIRFDAPSTDIGENYNTSLTVKGVPGKGYYGNVDVKYLRVSLADLGSAVVLRKEGQLTIEEITTMLNSLLSTFLSPDDLVPVTVPVLNPGDTASLTLTADPESLGWMDSVTITLFYGKPFLNVVVGRTALNAITPPGEKTDYPTAWALLYMMDFTSYRDALQIDGETKLYVDGAALQEVTNRLGIPGWAISWAAHYDTKDVPSSNQAFDRVVVQNNVGGNMHGPLFFHYNNFDGDNSVALS
jgi:hypothetical protein